MNLKVIEGGLGQGRKGLPTQPKGPDNTGEPPREDEMEARVGRLELKMDRIDDRLRGVEINLATLTERVSHLPGKGFLVTVVLGTGAVLSVLTLFPAQIKALMGL